MPHQLTEAFVRLLFKTGFPCHRILPLSLVELIWQKGLTKVLPQMKMLNAPIKVPDTANAN